MRAVRIAATGEPTVMSIDKVDLAAPGDGEIQVRHTAIGLNFIDTYHRSGLYPIALPSGLGMEAAGVVEAVGPKVTRFKKGDRVAYCSGPIGAYAERHNVPEGRAVAVPDAVPDETAAAIMLKGLTAWYLLRRTYKVAAGETILFHAAAGGVGQIACQWAKHLGVTVIGTAGSKEKLDLARTHGCAHGVNYNTEDFLARVKEVTKGEGVPVVYDSVGASTFEKSLDCLKPRGLMVSFGNASGPVPPFNLGLLAQKGSLYITRPTLFSYVAETSELDAAAAELFEVVTSGAVKININQRYKLDDVVQAHLDLEGRKTTGATILLP